MDNPAYIGAKSKKSNPVSNGQSGRGSAKTCCSFKRIYLCLLCFGVPFLGYTIYFFVTTCGTPESPEYGSAYKDGLSAKFTCDEGFSLVGDSAAGCLFYSKWSKPTPTCIPKCGVPTAPKDGTVSSEGLRAVFNCNDGFKLVGVSKSECHSNATWSSPAPMCRLRCGRLSPPEHGTMSTEGSRVTFRCNIGFILLGAAITRCLNDGTWYHPAPTCKLRCEIPIEPKYGTVTVDGSTVVFGCEKGFSLVGAHTAQCRNDGTWTNPTPKCMIKCNRLTPPNYGTLSDEGATVTFRCDDGFSLVGKSTLTCLDDGNWSDTRPTCTLSCSGPSNPQHGRVTVSGKTATFECNQGYRLSRTEEMICLKSGSWSNFPPACVRGSRGSITAGSWIMILACCMLSFVMATDRI